MLEMNFNFKIVKQNTAGLMLNELRAGHLLLQNFTHRCVLKGKN